MIRTKYFKDVKKYCIYKLLFNGLLSVVMIFPCQYLLAQIPDSTFWERLASQHKSRHTWHARWVENITGYADTSINLAKSAAAAEEFMRKSGMKDDLIKANLASQKDVFEKLQKGYAQKSYFDVISDGNTTIADVTTPPVILNQTEANVDKNTAHFVDIYDGINSIELSGMGRKIPETGLLSRDKKDILKILVPGFAESIFFLATPIKQYFSPSDATLQSDASCVTLIAKKTLEKDDFIFNLKVNSSDLSPISLERHNAYDNKLRFKIVVNKYQKYAEDFRLPNTITSTTLNGNGNRTREAIYTLDRITIDQEGDSKRLSHPVPHGTVIRDQRFGEKNATYYRVKQDIPSDEKIIALGKQIQEGEQRQAAEEMSQKVKVGLLIGLVTVFCIILVVILIRRYKMSKHS